MIAQISYSFIFKALVVLFLIFVWLVWLSGVHRTFFQKSNPFWNAFFPRWFNFTTRKSYFLRQKSLYHSVKFCDDFTETFCFLSWTTSLLLPWSPLWFEVTNQNRAEEICCYSSKDSWLVKRQTSCWNHVSPNSNTHFKLAIQPVVFQDRATKLLLTAGA